MTETIVIVNRLSRIIAIGFFTGYSPFAQGTEGNVWALIIFRVILGLRNYWPLSVSCIVFLSVSGLQTVWNRPMVMMLP